MKVWEIIVRLYNLIWPQEVKSLTFSPCRAGLSLHSNGFDSEAVFRSPFLALLPTLLRVWAITALYLSAVNWVIELIRVKNRNPKHQQH